MSRLSLVLLCALVGALVLSANVGAAARPTPKYCRLISTKDLARPMGVKKLTRQGGATSYQSPTRARGTLILCMFSAGKRLGVVVQSSVTQMSNARTARATFDGFVMSERAESHSKTTRVPGPWSAGVLLGARDGLLVTKGRYIFRLLYTSTAPRFSKITPQTLAGLAGRAVRKL